MKIPVFYHIPKCGGTYILQLYSYLNKEKQRRIKAPFGGEWDNRMCRTLNVYINQDRYIDIIGNIEIIDLQMLGSDIPSYQDSVDLDKLYYLIEEQKIDITCIFIQPTGDGNVVDSKDEVDKLILYINKQPIYFTIIRDIFQRLYSEYCYLHSQLAISNKEIFAKAYDEYNNFEDFLIRSDINNSITRQISLDSPLNKDSFENVKKFFDKFKVGNIQNIEQTAIDVWKQCYGWTAEYKNQELFKNKNKNKQEISIQDISGQAREQFLSKTEWDRKLYAYLSQM